MKKKYFHLNTTGFFMIAGIFMGGFTAIVLFGIQLGIKSFVQDCIDSWQIYIGLTWGLSLLIPVIRYIILKPQQKIEKSFVWIFNIVEYIMLQGALTVFFTSGKTFCFVNDGQNGLEFIFTAWLSLPLLLLMNYLFDLKVNGVAKDV